MAHNFSSITETMNRMKGPAGRPSSTPRRLSFNTGVFFKLRRMIFVFAFYDQQDSYIRILHCRSADVAALHQSQTIYSRTFVNHSAPGRRTHRSEPKAKANGSIMRTTASTSAPRTLISRARADSAKS